MSVPVAVVISDIHCGGTTALCPPGFKTSEGTKVGLSSAQEFLWAAWLELQDRLGTIIGDDKYDLILNGDLIEGMHHRTTEVWSPDPSDHMAAAVQCLTPIADDAQDVFVIRGTEAHTGPSSEIGIASMLGAVPDPKWGRPSFDRLDREYHGVPCRFVHHSAGTRREWTKSSALGIEAAQQRLVAVNNRRTPPRVLGFAHVHHYAVVGDGEWTAFRTPAWQFATRYAYKVIPSVENQCGAVVLDWRGREPGELPTLIPLLWRPK